MNIHKLTFFLGLILAFFAWHVGTAAAADKTWTPTSGVTWNTAANWTPSGVPTSTDNVIFSASSTVSSTIDVAVNVAQITITADYTGTITQSTGKTVTVGAGGYSQAAGTFAGSTGGNAVSIRGSFSLTGGTFRSTTGELKLASSTFNGGTFQHASGTVIFYDFSGATTTIDITGSSTFYNLAFGGFDGANMTFNIASGTVLTVQNWLGIRSYSNLFLFNGGEIDVQGDIVATFDADMSSLSIPSPGTTLIKVTGTGDQLIGNQTLCPTVPQDCDGIYLPSLEINKASGNVILSSFPQRTGSPSPTCCQVQVGGNWTNTSGATVSTGTSTVIFWTTASGTIPTITGSSTFYNLQFAVLDGSSAGAYFTIATGTTLTAQHQFTMWYSTSMVSFRGGGEIDIKGDVDDINYAFPGDTGEYLPSSTFNMVFNGTGTQTIAGSFLNLQDVTINKPSGVLNLAGQIYVNGAWTNNNGVAGVNAGTSTVTFLGQKSTAIVTGSSTFYNLEWGFEGDVTQYFIVATDTVVTVQSSTLIRPNFTAMRYLQGGGELDVQGNLLMGAGWQPGSAASSTFNLVVNGTSTQNISDEGHGLYNPGNFEFSAFQFPALTIDKPSGVAIVSSTYTIVSNNINILRGELRLSAATYFEVDGAISVSAGALFSYYPVVSSTIWLGSSVTNNGTIFWAGDGAGCTLPLPTHIHLRSTVNNTRRTWSGSGYYTMRYVAVKDQIAPTSSPIVVWNGTDAGNNSNWTFSNGNARPQLVQSSTAQGGSGTPPSSLSFAAYPRAGDLVIVAIASQNNAISAPTDNVGNTYSLVSSSTFGSPTHSLNLYYARNIAATSSFVITLNGTSSQAGTYLTAGAYEYTGMAPSSTFVASSTNSDSITATSTAITSLSAVGVSINELYFGAAIQDVAGAVFTPAAGWAAEFTNSCGGTCEKLYVEDMATTTILTTAATWTSDATTTYAAALAIFRSIYTLGYAASGTLDSSTFDTGVASGTQLNSLIWQGSQTNGTLVKFQVAVSNSSGGPWTYIGPGGDNTTYFSGNPGSAISLASTNGGFNLFSGYRYFRYRTVLFADPTQTYTPLVTRVSVNWSP